MFLLPITEIQLQEQEGKNVSATLSGETNE
jgi:hypothetical protein